MRRQARRGNGRFTRNTMENTFGLTVYVCAACRAMSPVQVGESRPELCHACGRTLVDIADERDTWPDRVVAKAEGR